MPGEGYIPRSGPVLTPHEMVEKESRACIADYAQAAKNPIAVWILGRPIPARHL